MVLAIAALGSANAQKDMDKFMVQVDGLGCPFCAYGLEKKFKEFKGIKDVKIDIETGDFSFNYPSEKVLAMQAVLAQVEKAGYTPITTKIERADGTVETSQGSRSIVEDGMFVTQTVNVAGNCDMCKARIEKAAMLVEGVSSAVWDKESKLLEVGLDPNSTSLFAVEKMIASKGHDTENHEAHGDDYGNLPACCQYERLNN